MKRAHVFDQPCETLYLVLTIRQIAAGYIVFASISAPVGPHKKAVKKIETKGAKEKRDYI